MVALQKAMQWVKNGKDGLVNIFSDSRFSLGVLTCPRTFPSLAYEARRDISEDRAVRLFWIRAHAGITGNEHADKLARQDALTKKTAKDYDRFHLSHTKKMEQAYRFLWKIEMTSQVAQTLMGHGGFAQYSYRFKLRDSPYWVCDSAKIQNVLHILEDCDMFHRERAQPEAVIDVRIARRNFPEILEDVTKTEKFLVFCDTITTIMIPGVYRITVRYMCIFLQRTVRFWHDLPSVFSRSSAKGSSRKEHTPWGYAGIALVTPLGWRVSMGDIDHLLSNE
ncbi:hypothetical protein EVAR_76667_1 [Eumeta japonica]|uniref:RNase H type-1 domain-containing protein n=1 Tax=Eumeta variegata TaxID=151549 RepID=A0A4C1YGQ9_EUMVA|nr:hypothetical protein EVAR_76667_1 [Eumeta japonica]